jgi:hypothetical protein
LLERLRCEECPGDGERGRPHDVPGTLDCYIKALALATTFSAVMPNSLYSVW